MDIFSTFAGEIPMTMELELYRTALILAGAVNLLIAVALLHNNIYFRIYDIYHRSRTFVALNYTIFGIGFLLHAYFCWRITWPEAASALTVSYFHSGGVLFGWSHISLMSLVHRLHLLPHIFPGAAKHQGDACQRTGAILVDSRGQAHGAGIPSFIRDRLSPDRAVRSGEHRHHSLLPP